MELVTKKRLQLYSGRSNLELAEEIAACLDVKLGEANLSEFASGELHCRFGESVRGSDVFILQSHADPVNTSIMEQAIMIDAAKRAPANRITAVCPYYGDARQDRKASGREPITAKLVADMLRTAGANRVVSVDLHSGQIQGFFDGPVDHLTAMPVLVDYLHREVDGDVTIVSPDAGRINVAERFSQHLDADLAFVYKRRRRGLRGHIGVGDLRRREPVLAPTRLRRPWKKSPSSPIRGACSAVARLGACARRDRSRLCSTATASTPWPWRSTVVSCARR